MGDLVEDRSGYCGQGFELELLIVCFALSIVDCILIICFYGVQSSVSFSICGCMQ